MKLKIFIRVFFIPQTLIFNRFIRFSEVGTLFLFYYILIIAGCLITLSGCKETENQQQSSAPKKIKITSQSVDGISLDMKIEKFIRQSEQKYRLDSVENSAFSLDGGGSGILVSDKNTGEKMYFIYSKSHRPETISGIIVLSDRCETREGIRIGMPIGELASVSDSFRIRLNLMPPPDEIYLPPQYQVSRNKKPYSVFTVGFYSESGKRLGKYSEDSEPVEKGTAEYDLSGKIGTIEMHLID